MGLRVATLALLLSACALTACSREGRPDWRVTNLYGGKGSVAILQEPERIEAFRIHYDFAQKRDVGKRYVGEFEVKSGPVDVPPDAAKELTSVLLDPSTYDWQRAKSCEFLPGVGLRIHREVSHIDIALCFSCDELMIFRQGKRVSAEDFDDARPRIVAVVKRLFPDDEQIQALE